jgi:transcriptional regulator with XRE-family HTH domain
LIGKNIKITRQKKKLSLRGLAEKAKISKSTLSDIETGKVINPNITTLEKIADALDIPLNYLLKKSAKSIIEQNLEKLNMTFEDLSKITNISINFFNSLDDIIPDPSDYRNMAIIEEKIGISSNELIKALQLQESPVYNSPISTSAYDDFKATKYDNKDKQYINTYMTLNDLGKNKVIEYTKDLLANPKYKKEEDKKVVELPKKEKQIWEEEGKEHLMPIACHNDNLTDEENNRMNDIINNYMKNKK